MILGGVLTSLSRGMKVPLASIHCEKMSSRELCFEASAMNNIS